jgi:hypothetical protein
MLSPDFVHDLQHLIQLLSSIFRISKFLWILFHFTRQLPILGVSFSEPLIEGLIELSEPFDLFLVLLKIVKLVIDSFLRTTFQLFHFFLLSHYCLREVLVLTH